MFEESGVTCDAACVGDFLLYNDPTWKGKKLEGCNIEGGLKFDGTAYLDRHTRQSEHLRHSKSGILESAGVFVRPSACHSKLLCGCRCGFGVAPQMSFDL